MEKTIKIGKKEINFKATGGTLCLYKQQFGTKYSEDARKLNIMSGSSLYSPERVLLERYRVGRNLVWAMAKNADGSIPDPETWYAGFKEFPLVEVLHQITPLFGEPEGTEESSDGEGITSESLCACAIACGFTMDDVFSMPIDFLVNCINEYVSLKGGKTGGGVRNATQADMDRF